MASIESLIRAALLDMSAVITLVGTGDNAKIRADHPDEGSADEAETPPYIVIEVDDEDHMNDLTGKGGRRMATVNLLCRGLTRAASRTLSEAVRVNGTNPGTGLAGYGGMVLSTVLDCWLEDESLAIVPRAEGSKRKWYDVNMSFMATALETT